MAQLEAGAGVEETWPIVRRARGVIRDLREEGRRMGWVEPAVGHARRADELIAQIAPFYAQYGVDAKRFADTFNSFGVDAKINRAKQFAVKTRIEGTPAIVVNGKYTVPVDQQGFGKMLNTVDWLVAKERGGAN